jgi:hypothetical protein
VPVPQHVEGVLKIARIGAGDLDSPAVSWVGESQRAGVQPLALQAETFGQHRVRAVGRVADTGVMQRGEVHPDLMGAAGLEVDVKQAGGPEHLEGVVMGDAVPAVLGDRELPLASAMTADWGVDRPTRGVRMSLHHSVIARLLSQLLFLG